MASETILKQKETEVKALAENVFVLINLEPAFI